MGREGVRMNYGCEGGVGSGGSEGDDGFKARVCLLFVFSCLYVSYSVLML